LGKDDGPRPYQLFMLGLCVYVLVALGIETFFSVSESTRAILGYVDTGICVIFLGDFVRCLLTAERKLAYLKWGWIDLVSSIPMLDFVRWGRIARVVRIIRVLRGVRSTRMLLAVALARRAESAFMSAALVAVLLVTFSSIAILHVETGPEANIASGQDAVWWSVVTITTVGYGDKYPVSVEGRIIAVVLMCGGIGLFGTFTAFVASWFLAPGAKKQEDDLAEMRRDLKALRETVDRMAAEKAP